MSRDGWVRIWRKMLDSLLWSMEPEHFKVAIACILTAADKEMEIHLPEYSKTISLKPGELYLTIRTFAEQNKVSEKNVRTALEKLASDEFRFLDVIPSQFGTIIRILNWEQYQGGDDKSPPENPLEAIDRVPFEEIALEWNMLAKKYNLPEVKTISAERQRHLKNRWKDANWRKNWRTALNKIPASPFLLGSKGWRANFDWFIRPDSVIKLIEGQFETQKGLQKTGFKDKKYTEGK